MVVGWTTEDDETKLESVVVYLHVDRSYVGSTYSDESFDCEYTSYIYVLAVWC